MRNLGPEWIAAIALSAQALIFLLQAGFLWWQASILRRHATTLEEHTKISDTQAETLKLIASASEQQGRVLAEQTKIMDEQFKFQRKVDAKVERGNLFTLVIEAQTSLEGLVSRLSRLQQSNLTQEDSLELSQSFDMLVQNITACQKAVFIAIHLSAEEKKYYLAYGHDLGTLNQSGNIAEDFRNADALRGKYRDLLFSSRLGQLGQIPETIA